MKKVKPVNTFLRFSLEQKIFVQRRAARTERRIQSLDSFFGLILSHQVEGLLMVLFGYHHAKGGQMSMRCRKSIQVERWDCGGLLRRA